MDERHTAAEMKIPCELSKRGPFWFRFSRDSKVGWWSLGIWFYHDYYVRFSIDIGCLFFDFECGWRKSG